MSADPRGVVGGGNPTGAEPHPERMAVKDGAPGEACPLCGILRVHAGYIEASCGTHLRKPGCFVESRRD